MFTRMIVPVTVKTIDFLQHTVDAKISETRKNSFPLFHISLQSNFADVVGLVNTQAFLWHESNTKSLDLLYEYKRDKSSPAEKSSGTFTSRIVKSL